MSHLLRWKRKWAVIHNTASLKTSIRWSLLSLLLIAWYRLCHWEAFILEPIYSNIRERPECLAAATTANIMFSHVPNSWRGSFRVHYISCFINARTCFLTPAAFLDMRELSLSREGYSSYLGVSQELKVRVGDEVVLKCSASSSEEPSYFWNKKVRKHQQRAQWQWLRYALGKLDIVCPRPTLQFQCEVLFFHIPSF